MSFLESSAVRPKTEEQYHRAAFAFVGYCRENGLPLASDAEIDEALTEYFGELYHEGVMAAEGQKILAAVGHYAPRFGKNGGGALPRSRRALQGWHRLRPPQQRLPLPKSFAYAIVGSLLARGEVSMALRVVVSFSAYLRPCEARVLLVKHLVPPMTESGRQAPWGLLLHDSDTGIPGKTGVLDDSVLLDDLVHLNPIFEVMRGARPPEEKLFPTPELHFKMVFDEVCRKLLLAPLQPCLYALRHGGASEDLRSRARSPLEVQLRGRWRTATSLRRYGKASRLMTQSAKVPSDVARFGISTQRHLLSMIMKASVNATRPRDFRAKDERRGLE